LHRITPENAHQYVKEQVKCESRRPQGGAVADSSRQCRR
jgi:hypothetical protein